MNRHIACYCVGCSNGKACLVLPEPDAKPKSDRTKAFLASWSRATFGLGLDTRVGSSDGRPYPQGSVPPMTPYLILWFRLAWEAHPWLVLAAIVALIWWAMGGRRK
jgi:hypothetical protein